WFRSRRTLRRPGPALPSSSTPRRRAPIRSATMHPSSPPRRSRRSPCGDLILVATASIGGELFSDVNVLAKLRIISIRKRQAKCEQSNVYTFELLQTGTRARRRAPSQTALTHALSFPRREQLVAHRLRRKKRASALSTPQKLT